MISGAAQLKISFSPRFSAVDTARQDVLLAVLTASLGNR